MDYEKILEKIKEELNDLFDKTLDFSEIKEIRKKEE